MFSENNSLLLINVFFNNYTRISFNCYFTRNAYCLEYLFHIIYLQYFLLKKISQQCCVSSIIYYVSQINILFFFNPLKCPLFSIILKF